MGKIQCLEAEIRAKQKLKIPQSQRDTRPLKCRDLTNKCSLREDPKRSFIRKILSVKEKKIGWGSISFAQKPECGITQSRSKIDFYIVLTSSRSSSSLPSMTMSLVALVGLKEKRASQAINQVINQASKILTL